MNTQYSQSELDTIEQEVVRKVLSPNSYIVPEEGIELVKSIEAYVTTRVKEAEERAQIKGEIIGKKAAYRKAIMGAGEYHDDPYSYVVPIEHLRQYEAELSQFDLSEPIFRDKALTTTTNGKETP